MEIMESSKINSQQNSDAETEGHVCEPLKRIHHTSISSDERTCRTRGGKIESVSDLEDEETKGFLDLGFVFTEKDLSSELLEILPGLRNFLSREEQRKAEYPVVPRPYLSEAWDFYGERRRGRTEKDSMVIDLRMAALCGEKSMKDNLKLWARSVASNLK